MVGSTRFARAAIEVHRAIARNHTDPGAEGGSVAQRRERFALPVVLAGVRIATVVSIGLATIAAAIGAGGLGVLIYRGVAIVDHRLILAGAVPAALLALGADGLLGWIERRLEP